MSSSGSQADGVVRSTLWFMADVRSIRMQFMEGKWVK